MPDLKITSQRQQIYSPVDFFNSLKKDLEEAKSGIIIRSFLFRNDKAGILVAQSLNSAAERGVKILIIKDRMGAIFEYAEQSGHSFFHDEPKKNNPSNPHSLIPIYRYGRIMRTFYGVPPSTHQKNHHLDLLIHKNITVIDRYKINDHSKAVIIDGKIGYIGGVNFGEEYFPPQNWIDFMLRVEGEDSLKLLYSPDSIYLDREQLDFISGTRENLTIIMAFMANKSYLHALINLVNHGKKVFLITAKKPSSNRYSNSQFIRLLVNGTKENHQNLTICLKPEMVHGKILIRDNETVRIGSQNMCIEKGAYNETVAETDNQQVIQELLQAANQDPSKDIILTGNKLNEIKKFFPILHVIPAYTESIAKSVQLWAEKHGRKEIEKARAICEETINKFISGN
jgi:cardiolipin synthase A/B